MQIAVSLPARQPLVSVKREESDLAQLRDPRTRFFQLRRASRPDYAPSPELKWVSHLHGSVHIVGLRPHHFTLIGQDDHRRQLLNLLQLLSTTRLQPPPPTARHAVRISLAVNVTKLSQHPRDQAMAKMCDAELVQPLAEPVKEFQLPAELHGSRAAARPPPLTLQGISLDEQPRVGFVTSLSRTNASY